MAHNYPVPSDTDLEQMITQSFAALPEPDYSSLKLIEERVFRKARLQKREKNLNKIPWWIVLLLAGSFATAAWWMEELFMDKQNRDISDKQTSVDGKIEERQETDDIRNKNNESFDNRDSKIIYQRESF
ncbi:MAG: hypothetical protein AAF419_00735 [Pseudomonadota bacterium]